QESFSGARVIKAFGREREEEQRFQKLSQHWASLNVKLAQGRALLTVFIEVGGGVSLVGILLLLGWKVIDGELKVGTLVTFIGYLQILVWPMIAIGWVLALWERAKASEGRLQALRNEIPEI